MATTLNSNAVRIRVLFVIGTMGGGGAERQIIEILKRIDRARFQPLLYLAMKQGELLVEVPEDVPIFAFWDHSPESITRTFFRTARLTRLLRYIHLARVLHDQQIDVIYDRTYLATLDSAGACLFRSTPRISCCVVDPEPELEVHSRFSKGLSWWFARMAYRGAKIVLANSEGLRSRVIDYFRLKPDRVKVFYNLLASIPDSTAATEALPESRPFLIVNAGRLHPQKGQQFLLEAIHDLVNKQGRDLRLVILGTGESESALRDYLHRQNLDKCVTLQGFVANPYEWYRKADLFVLSSLYEGMPNALIEAAACGTPVISTDCPSGPAEVLDQGRCGQLIPVADSLALSKAIADAMDHPEQRRFLAGMAKKRVHELFDPQIQITRLEELLTQMSEKKQK